MADQDYTLELKRYTPQDPRLGRHKAHDSRSLQYKAPAKSPRKLSSVRHELLIPVLNQGDIGACTGFAGAEAVSTRDYWGLTESIFTKDDPNLFGVRLYSEATIIDPWPGSYKPDDTGSDGLSVAKVLKTMGLISGYMHATSVEACLTALAERPVMIGIGWRTNMFDPKADGMLDIGGVVEGGHEVLLDELDIANQRVGLRNHWTETWGLKGRAYLSIKDLDTLLKDDGDCTILVPTTLPPPQPTPVPVTPTPTPAPSPAPQPNDPGGPTAEDLVLHDALQRFMRSKGVPTYVRNAATPWLKTK
jgi:hypothetical protein